MLSEPKVMDVGLNGVPFEIKMLIGIVSPVTY
jgi:hypothetical protein